MQRAAEYDRVNGTDPRARQHRERRFGNHRHVNEYAVSAMALFYVIYFIITYCWPQCLHGERHGRETWTGCLAQYEGDDPFAWYANKLPEPIIGRHGPYTVILHAARKRFPSNTFFFLLPARVQLHTRRSHQQISSVARPRMDATTSRALPPSPNAPAP